MSTNRASSPLPSYFRWAVLVIMSLICFAQYFIYDSITPLGTIIKQELNFTGSDYGSLFSAYAVANVFLFMLLLAGVLVDKIGLKRSGILYGFLCFAGAVLTALGAMPSIANSFNSFYRVIETPFVPVFRWLGIASVFSWAPTLKTMLLGRAIYGIGAEAILVVNNKVLARWFKGKELAFAYGMNLTIMRLGTFLALNTQAPVAGKWGLIQALWFAAVVMGLGFASFFGYLLLERLSRGREGSPSGAAGAPGPEEKFRLKEAFSFDASFWFISLLCVTFYSAVFPFQSYAPDILVQKFGYSVATAGTYASALILGTMIFTPIFGWFVDHRGRRATLMIFGSLLLIPCHVLLGYTRFLPVVPIFVVGIALSLVPAALWAAIPMMVPEKRLGTAFGVVGYIQNVGLFLFPLLAGKIADAHTAPFNLETLARIMFPWVPGLFTNMPGFNMVNYTYTMLLFVILGVAGFVFSLLLKQADRRRTDGISIEKVLLK